LNEQFEGIFCCDLLGHLKRASLAISELIRICRRGGYIVGNLFAIGDSTRGIDMRIVGKEEYVYKDKFYFKFYDRQGVVDLLQSFNIEIVSLKLIRWTEPPHKGYREYAHQHQSWVFAMRKLGG
jgi:hypothetical protein